MLTAPVPVTRPHATTDAGPGVKIVSTSLPKCSPASSRAWASATSASGRTESITGTQDWWATAASRPAKSRGLPIVVPSSETWPIGHRPHHQLDLAAAGAAEDDDAGRRAARS